MEKIHKLLTSGREEDVEVGLHLLIASSEKDIKELFIKKGRAGCPGSWDMSIKYYKQLFSNYIEVSDNYVLCHFTDGDLRLREKGTPGWGEGWPIKTKENYLNGVY